LRLETGNSTNSLSSWWKRDRSSNQSTVCGARKPCRISRQDPRAERSETCLRWGTWHSWEGEKARRKASEPAHRVKRVKCGSETVNLFTVWYRRKYSSKTVNLFTVWNRRKRYSKTLKMFTVWNRSNFFLVCHVFLIKIFFSSLLKFYI
jgi:hypothetical protein